MSRTPNYILTAEHVISYDAHDEKILPAGAFVRPIELMYLPVHIKDKPEWRWMNREKEVFCYTRFGIIPIPKSIIRQV